jgi:tRNA(fMet)-specific endonuclease VapC
MAIGLLNVLIAGTALSRDAVLATNNIKEFSRIEGLKLADWTR